MKKMILATLATGIMSVGVFAADGTVNTVVIKVDGVVKMELKKAIDDSLMLRTIDGTVEANKAMLATVLTAKSSGATIDAYSDGTKWTKIILK